MPTVLPSPGELIILGFENNNLDMLYEFHREYSLGGVILFDRNIESSKQLKELISTVR